MTRIDFERRLGTFFKYLTIFAAVEVLIIWWVMP